MISYTFIIIIASKGGDDHPTHLHGYDFFVVAMEAVGNKEKLTNVKSLNEQGLIRKNLKTPVVTDTVGVPTAGYTIIRFIANNPGYWLIHCHVTLHLYLGLGFVLKVGEEEDTENPPKYFTKCGPATNNFLSDDYSCYNH